MRTLALDLSMSCTGWALSIGERNQIYEYGELVGPEHKMPEGLKFLVMDRALKALIATAAAEKVIFAEFHNTPNVMSGHASLGLRAILLRRCEIMRVGCYPVSEMSARKKLGVDLSSKLTPEEQQDYDRRLQKWNLRGRQTSQPKPKRDMKARVDKVLKTLGHNIASEDARDAVVLLLGRAL